jgi:hypothetical protein
MLSPSLRTGAFTGLEWSFEMRDLGFDERGRLLGADIEEKNEAAPNSEDQEEDENDESVIGIHQ